MATANRLQRALQSEGYWAGTTRIEHGRRRGRRAGRCWSGWTRPRQRPLPVRIVVDKGQPYRIARIGAARPSRRPSSRRWMPAAATPFGLAVGDPARAEPVLAAERILLDRLLAAGHPLASMVRRETTVDHDREGHGRRLDLRPRPGRGLRRAGCRRHGAGRPGLPARPGRRGSRASATARRRWSANAAP